MELLQRILPFLDSGKGPNGEKNAKNPGVTAKWMKNPGDSLRPPVPPGGAEGC